MLLHVDGGRFAGGAHRHDPGHAGLVLKLDQGLESREVNAAMAAERRHDGCINTTEHLTFLPATTFSGRMV